MKHYKVHRKIKPTIRHMSKFFGKYINGWKGAVSIFLALITAPFLSLTLLIVESARYQSAVELMDEVIDSSAFSVLAEYDSYLEERFGVMAVSQGVELNGDGGFRNGETEFAKYLDDNAANIGVNILKDSAEGKFPLSDSGVLKQQLLENSEVSAALEMLINGLDIDELLKKINEAFSCLDEISKQAEAISATADVGDAVADIINNIKEAITTYKDDYSPAYNEYWEKYYAFEQKADDLAKELGIYEEKHKNEKKDDETDEGEDTEDSKYEPYSDENVKNAVDDCEDAAKDYKEASSDFKTHFSALKGNIDSVLSGITGLTAKINKMNSKINKCSEKSDQKGEGSKTVATSGMADASASWFAAIAEEASTAFKEIFGMSFTTDSQRALNDLNEKIYLLGQFDAENDVDSDTTKSDIKREYGPVDTSCIPGGLDYKLKNIIDILNQEEPIVEDESLTIDDILTFLNKLLDVHLLYDANLNSVLSESALYQADTNSNLGDLLFGESISNLSRAGQDFWDSFAEHDIVKRVVAAAEFLVSVAEFLASLVMKVAEMTASIIELVSMLITDPGEIFNRMLLYSYAAYNLPNRTNYNSGKSLSGYSFNKIYTAAGGTAMGTTVSGIFSDMGKHEDKYGSDMMFKGAEGEYILVGTANEKQNQSITAYDLLLFRIILDIFPVMGNEWVGTLSASTGVFAPLVYIGMILGEAFVDTLLIVNGVSVYFVKMPEYIYLSPSGVKDLIKDGLSMTNLSKTLQEKITKKDDKNTKKEEGSGNNSEDESGSAINNDTGKTDGGGGTKTDKPAAGDGDSQKKKQDKEIKGFFDADYREHLIMLMFLNRCTTEKYLARMKNLIQTEAAVNYKYNGGFGISKAYTYIKTDVEYELKAMFNLESLTGNGLLKVRTSEYHGY